MFLYLSDDPSDVSGYKKLYINGRSPNATTSFAASTTTVAAGVLTTVANLTLTGGGSQAVWLSAPLEADVTIDAQPIVVTGWGGEDAASTNAQFAVRVAEYTTSEQSAFITTSRGVELSTNDDPGAAPRVSWAPGTTFLAGGSTNTESVSSTTIDAGNRIAIVPGYTGAGANTAAGTVTFYYGATADTLGDTFVALAEAGRAGAAQVGNGANAPGIPAKGVSYFLDLANAVQDGVDEGLLSVDTTAQAIIDEGNNEADLS